MIFKRLLFYIIFTISAPDSAWGNIAPPISITADYPGGNIVVDRINGETVRLHQDLRDTQGWWFYWNFRVNGISGQTVKFKFKGKSPIGVRGPAISLDRGISWSWLGAQSVERSAFSYTFPAIQGPVQFAFSIPYQESNLRLFLDKFLNDQSFIEETLCITSKGRIVEMLRAGCINNEPQYRVLLTARHHACESIASFVLEGILAESQADNASGAWLREHVEIMAIPFMDKDGVEDGDQGKNRLPRDHNRDYLDTSIHPEVASLRRKIDKWSQGKLCIALDLHCPSLRGDSNEDIYLVGSPYQSIETQQFIFSALLEKINSGPLPYEASNNLLFGESWNTTINYSQGKSFSQWAGEREEVRLSGTFEIPYANAGGEVISPRAARLFGRSIAKTIYIYLEALEP